MESGATGSLLLTYFSHSYRPEDKRINLFFWEILSKFNLYFTVDAKKNYDEPMDITYLEWMMHRSACFVAVIPRRDDVLPIRCSPYQLFENNLAIRARKPRLIFVEEGLNRDLFGLHRDEVCFFRRRGDELRADEKKFTALAQRLGEQAHATADPAVEGLKPVALVLDMASNGPYDVAAKRIEHKVRQQGLSFVRDNPSQFEQDQLFLRHLENYSILISEVRPPYIDLDIFGLIHGRCLPTIRVSYLEESEDKQQAEEAMRLSPVEEGRSQRKNGRWPTLLSNYKVDETMEPVIFWTLSKVDELECKIDARLKKIREERRDLRNEQEAREYFLRIGRPARKVFISNAKKLNPFVDSLKSCLEQEAVDAFHYKDVRDPGSPDWEIEIYSIIDDAILFIALIDSTYEFSDACMWELHEGIKRFNQGMLQLHTYAIGSSTRIPKELLAINKHVEPLESDNHIESVQMENIQKIVEKTIEFLEKGRRVRLSEREEERILKIWEDIPTEAIPNWGTLLRKAGLSEACVQSILPTENQEQASKRELLRRLADQNTEDISDKTPLGLVLYQLMGHADDTKRGEIAQITRAHSLMPDIRRRLANRTSMRELGVALFAESGAVGTFEYILHGKLMGFQKNAHGDGSKLFSLLVNAMPQQDQWQEWLKRIGQGMLPKEVFSHLIELYGEVVGPTSNVEEPIGLCIACDLGGMAVPFEWTTFNDFSVPLCLKHPVRRYLFVHGRVRPSLWQMLKNVAPSPLRALIIGANTGHLPRVEEEVETIRKMISKLSEDYGWPESDIKVMKDDEATAPNIEQAIRYGGYHILHFAGHSMQAENRPGIAVFDYASKGEAAPISATELRQWISDSDLRFVYLGSCGSANPDAGQNGKTIRQFNSVLQAVVVAGVPEVLGFIWPIKDSESKDFAQQFYRYYLQGFDASVAAFEARRSFAEDARVWAAPLVIQNTDSIPIDSDAGQWK